MRKRIGVSNSFTHSKMLDYEAEEFDWEPSKSSIDKEEEDNF